MKTYELKQLDILSVAKIYATITLIFSFIIGLIGGIMAAISEPLMGVLFFFAIVIGYPIAMFIFALIGAAIYNFIASKIGGIKIQLEEKK